MNKLSVGIVLVSALLLASCGGGGGGSDSPADDGNTDDITSEEFYQVVYPETVSLFKGQERKFLITALSLQKIKTNEETTYEIVNSVDGISIDTTSDNEAVVTISDTTNFSGKLTIEISNSTAKKHIDIDVNTEDGIVVFDKTTTGQQEVLTDEHSLFHINIPDNTTAIEGTNIKIFAIRRKDGGWSYTTQNSKQIIDESKMSITLPNKYDMDVYWLGAWENK